MLYTGCRDKNIWQHWQHSRDRGEAAPAPAGMTGMLQQQHQPCSSHLVMCVPPLLLQEHTPTYTLRLCGAAARKHCSHAVCLVLTQVYHAWNQLRALDMPVRSWPSVMAAVVAELLAENPIRGRIMLGAAMWAMQVRGFMECATSLGGRQPHPGAAAAASIGMCNC